MNGEAQQCDVKNSWCARHSARAKDGAKCSKRKAWEREFGIACVGCGELCDKRDATCLNPDLATKKDEITWPTVKGKPEYYRLIATLLKCPGEPVCAKCKNAVTAVCGDTLARKESAWGEPITVFVPFKAEPVRNKEAPVVPQPAATQAPALQYQFQSADAVARAAANPREHHSLTFAQPERVTDGRMLTPCIVAANCPPGVCDKKCDWKDLRVITPEKLMGKPSHYGFCPDCARVINSLEMPGVRVSDISLFEAITGKEPQSEAMVIQFSRKARCNMGEEVSGDPQERLGTIPHLNPVAFRTSDSCFDALAETGPRYFDLLRTHAEPGIGERELRDQKSEARKAAKQTTKACPLHGAEFGQLGKFRFAVIERIKEQWPEAWKKGSKEGNGTMGKFTCAECNAKVNKLFGDPPTLCGKCLKRERNQQTAATRDARRNAKRFTARVAATGKEKKKRKSNG